MCKEFSALNLCSLPVAEEIYTVFLFLSLPLDIALIVKGSLLPLNNDRMWQIQDIVILIIFQNRPATKPISWHYSCGWELLLLLGIVGLRINQRRKLWSF